MYRNIHFEFSNVYTSRHPIHAIPGSADNIYVNIYILVYVDVLIYCGILAMCCGETVDAGHRALPGRGHSYVGGVGASLPRLYRL